MPVDGHRIGTDQIAGDHGFQHGNVVAGHRGEAVAIAQAQGHQAGGRLGATQRNFFQRHFTGAAIDVICHENPTVIG